MTPAKRHYLHHKLAKAVFWAALLFATLTSTLLFIVEFRQASEKTAGMLNQLLDTIESTAAVAAYSGNQAIGEDLLKGLLRNDIVHEAHLSNGRGLELRQARATKVLPQAEITRILHSPFGDQEIIGHLGVAPEAQFILQEVRHSALLGALNSSLLISLTALLLLVLVRSSLSRSLMHVSGTLHAIKAGEQERLPSLPRHQDDELGQIVEDINGLLATLEEKFAAERLLREEIQVVEHQLRNIFETTSAGIFLLDDTGRLRMANPTLTRVLRLPDGEPGDLMRQDFLQQVFTEPERMRNLIHQADERGQAVARDLRLKHPGNAPAAWVHCLLSRQTDATGVVHYEGVVYDVTERLAAEEHARHEADHDSLTGLLRRQAVERELSNLLETPADGTKAHIIFLLDLDHFKSINDTYGHAAGDRVLVETARRLKACVRTSDLVARLGGDEFLIVLANRTTQERSYQIARDLIVEITRPIPLDPVLAVRVGASIGIAIHEGREERLAELLEAADHAMYEVKRQGRNGFAMARPDGSFEVETAPTVSALPDAAQHLSRVVIPTGMHSCPTDAGSDPGGRNGAGERAEPR